jgi:hypothetical protein
MTFAAACAAVASQLGSPSAPFWSTSEIELYVQEALRTWNAATGYYRDRIVFQTQAGVPFYDLPTQAPAKLGFSMTDRMLIAEIEYHLLEPPTPTAWTGSDMFDLASLTQALQRRRDQFLAETGVFVRHLTNPIAPPPAGRVALGTDLLDVRRVAWKNLAGVYANLWREDESRLNSYMPTWSLNPADPQVYSVAATPAFQVQLAPPPLDNGELDLLVVTAGIDLDPTAGISGTLLGIPDDYTWAVKWGALADLLGRDGPARDPLRSQYAEGRWREACALARSGSPMVHAAINGVPVPFCSVTDLDVDRPGWMNTSGRPSVVAFAAPNLVVLADVPDAIYSVGLDLEVKAPVPILSSDPVFLASGVLNGILDYAVHLAAFKMGGAEFQATMPHLERLMRLAALQHDKIRADIPEFAAIFGETLREPKQRPRRKSDVQKEVVEYAAP